MDRDFLQYVLGGHRLTKVEARAEIIATYLYYREANGAHVDYGDEPCPFMDFLHECPLEGEELRRAVMERPDAHPKRDLINALVCEFNIYTAKPLTEATAYTIARIVEQPFEELGGRFQRVIEEYGSQIDASLWPAIIKWIAGGHPRPAMYLAKQAIRSVIPDTQEVRAAWPQ